MFKYAILPLLVLVGACEIPAEKKIDVFTLYALKFEIVKNYADREIIDSNFYQVSSDRVVGTIIVREGPDSYAHLECDVNIIDQNYKWSCQIKERINET